ncbi:MAG: hypothetical protein GX749_06925 [Ruminococcaceae bacterium]|nr:hypothetical protein [Oscillospiraceae bacterium]
MNRSEINQKIKNAVDHAVPDVLDSILSDSDKARGKVIEMNPNKRNSKRWLRSAAAAAAVFIFVIAGVASYSIYGARAVDSVISFDVNPSLELKVNRNEKVLAVNPLNPEGKQVVGGMDFKNTDLDVAVNALIGSMLKNGYINNSENSILISVENRNSSKGSALQAKLSEEISGLLRASAVNGAVMSQNFKADDDLDELAATCGITLGKANIISQLIKAEASYSFEELAKLSIHELNLLIESGKLELPGISSSGTATPPTAPSTSPTTSTPESTTRSTSRKETTSTTRRETTATSTQESKSTTRETTGSQAQRITRLTASEARNMVISKFGVSTHKTGIIEKIEYTYDESNPLYKGEAVKNGSRVVFELNARTKAFVKWDVGNDNDWNKYAAALPKMISMNQAANSVIAKSGNSNTFVQKIDFKSDDSKPMYQGEAWNKGVKYSFEIYAYGGSFGKWDVSRGDDTWAEKYYNVR